MNCCFCGRDAGKFGNNIHPIDISFVDGRCCDRCNYDIVIPIKLAFWVKDKFKENVDKKENKK